MALNAETAFKFTGPEFYVDLIQIVHAHEYESSKHDFFL